MKRWFVIFSLLFFYPGCKSIQPPDETVTPPQLLYQVPLPPWPVQLPTQPVKLDLMIFVDTSGKVLDARFTRPTGSPEWDSESLQRIRQWRFSPPLVQGKPVARWVQLSVRVNFEEPFYMTLAELVCPDRTLADSLYKLLQSDASFEQLVGQFSVGASRQQQGHLGNINVRTLPNHIQKEVLKLEEGQFTAPLPRGREYVIFKRLHPMMIP